MNTLKPPRYATHSILNNSNADHGCGMPFYSLDNACNSLREQLNLQVIRHGWVVDNETYETVFSIQLDDAVPFYTFQYGFVND